jgi:UDP-N-acetylmuramate--alanine ligase
MNIEQVHRVYFIGIGGIGMSAIARYFNQKNVKVSGYDRYASPLTKQLESEGMSIHYEENPELADKSADLVVYTPAVPLAHQELQFYHRNNYPVLKRSEVLQLITANDFIISVAGTHGKTTTTTLIAHILRHSGRSCNAFLGGISVNYNTNFWSGEENIAVIEADEYDRSFLRLNPDIAVLTATDADHLDIYGTVEAMEEAYIEYTKNIKPNGTLIYKKGIHREYDLLGYHQITYHLDDKTAGIHATNIQMKNGCYHFDIEHNDWTIKGMTLNAGGQYNIENSVAAVAVTYILGISAENIKTAVNEFKGVKRRFEYILKNEKVVYIDDYAHHPEELRALINGARSLFPGKNCIIAFQPHLYSRTRDLADGFAASLSLADEIILLPIYPAREEPIKDVSSKMIADKMQNKNVQVLSKEASVKYISEQKISLFISAGAGDIDQLIPAFKQALINQ